MAQKTADDKVNTVEKSATDKIEAAKKEAESAVQRMMAAEKEKEKAIARVEANSLSHYIVQTLKERRDRKQTKEDDEK